jgi:hypothetical protein
VARELAHPLDRFKERLVLGGLVAGQWHELGDKNITVLRRYIRSATAFDDVGEVL